MIVVPGKIKSKARPRFNTRTGRAFTPSDTINYEKWVKTCYIEQSNIYHEGDLKATIIAYFEIPKSYNKRRVQAILEGLEKPRRKIDADNIGKVITDALNGIAYKDDVAIVELLVKKEYTTEQERVEFEIEIV